MINKLAYHKSSGFQYRCPLCFWEVSPEDKWLCGECGYVWNTFKTQGCCPNCDYQWTMTACLKCGQWSPHKEWYTQKHLN